jgi:hypothetical protein
VHHSVNRSEYLDASDALRDEMPPLTKPESYEGAFYVLHYHILLGTFRRAVYPGSPQQLCLAHSFRLWEDVRMECFVQPFQTKASALRLLYLVVGAASV